MKLIKLIIVKRRDVTLLFLTIYRILMKNVVLYHFGLFWCRFVPIILLFVPAIIDSFSVNVVYLCHVGFNKSKGGLR